MKITGFGVSHQHNHFWYLATSMRQIEENFKTALYTNSIMHHAVVPKENQVC